MALPITLRGLASPSGLPFESARRDVAVGEIDERARPMDLPRFGVVRESGVQLVVKVADDDVGPVLLDPSLPAAICLRGNRCVESVRTGGPSEGPFDLLTPLLLVAP